MSGEPLILLPGLLCDAALWAHQTRHLTDQGPVLVADLTGADSLDALAEAVLAMAPPRFALAGLSMGGYTAFAILRRAPERVTRLALLNTTARPDRPEQTARRRQLMELAQAGRFALVTPQLAASFIAPERLEDPAVGGVVRAMLERVGVPAFLRQQQAILARPDSRPGLPAIACPTLVVTGRQDALTPLETHQEMAAAIPGARLAVVEECAHLSPLEQPQAVTALLRLWRDF